MMNDSYVETFLRKICLWIPEDARLDRNNPNLRLLQVLEIAAEHMLNPPNADYHELMIMTFSTWRLLKPMLEPWKSWNDKYPTPDHCLTQWETVYGLPRVECCVDAKACRVLAASQLRQGRRVLLVTEEHEDES